ncbi:MAG: LysR family transcriptional regulator [Polyangiaceae bacterium]|jgi:DNA-binding transcriptional LysR family regulator|nr:LysR family transcriptional regulator [Polyangiaceae bacterium]
MSIERDTFAGMAAFLASVEGGSFSAAAAKLGLTPSGVSKLVGRLEERLGVRLLQRTTRQMQLTHVGAAYFERAQRIMEELRVLEDEVSGSDDTPRGLLRVTAPVGLGHARVLPAVVAFRRAFPEVKVDLVLADRIVDLIEERVDVAVRMTASPPLSSVAKKLADDVRLLCASPDYLARRGRPASVADLAEHECIVFVPVSGAAAPWKLTSGEGKVEAVRVAGHLHLNNLPSLRDAALAGLGIVDLPAYLVGDELRSGRLVTVLDEFVAVDRAIYAVYAPSAAVPARSREFVKLLAEQFVEPRAEPPVAPPSKPPVAPEPGPRGPRGRKLRAS